MKDATLHDAVNEAKRFIEVCEKYSESESKTHGYQSKERSAVKRSSMDLTRKLADLRLGR